MHRPLSGGAGASAAGVDDGGLPSVAPPQDPLDVPSSLPPSMDVHYGDSQEEHDVDEDDQGEGEPDNDLARLLSHLREFSELANMVSIQTSGLGFRV